MLATEENKLKSFSLAKIKWLDIKKEKFAKSDEIQSLVSESCDPWVSDKTFDVVLFIYSNIAHYFLTSNCYTNMTMALRCHARLHIKIKLSR